MQRPKRRESEISKRWRKGVPGKGKGKCKGMKAGTILTGSKTVRKWN